MTDHVLVNDPSRGVCTCGVPTRFDRDTGWAHDPQTPLSEGRKHPPDRTWHRRAVSGDGYFEPHYDVCLICAQDWPCQASIEADRADKAEAERDEWRPIVEAALAYNDCAMGFPVSQEDASRWLIEKVRDYRASHPDRLTVALGPGQFDSDEGGRP